MADDPQLITARFSTDYEYESSWPSSASDDLVADNCHPPDSFRYLDEWTDSGALPAPHVPTPPARRMESTIGSTDSSTDLYGPDRLFGPLLVTYDRERVDAAQPGIPATPHTEIGVPCGIAVPIPEPWMAIDTGLPSTYYEYEQQLKDPVARSATNVTPGVTDTPYLLYALNTLTGDIPSSFRLADGNSGSNVNSNTGSYSIQNDVNDIKRGHFNPWPLPYNIPRASMDQTVQTPISLPPPAFAQPRPRLPGAEPKSVSTSTSTSAVIRPLTDAVPPRTLKDITGYLEPRPWTAYIGENFPRPDFKPAILRPASLLAFVSMCVLMDAGLIFSAVYSRANNGFAGYNGNIYGDQYFVFRVLPQLLAVVVFLHAHVISRAVIRILPFARMGAVDPDSQSLQAIFDSLYPSFLIWPHLSGTGTCCIWVPLLFFWLLNFVVPLQSAAFAVIVADGKLRWAAVQGVVWTLVGLYSTAAFATLLLLAYWRNRITGLLCDPRSIADIIVLASSSDALADYHGTEVLRTRGAIRAALLRHRGSERLGYWSWYDGHGKRIYHGIGAGRSVSSRQWSKSSTKAARRKEKTSGSMPDECQQTLEDDSPVDIDLEDLALSTYSEAVRYRYLPWCLRTGPLLCASVAAFGFLLALFIVSFLPSTGFRTGFLPIVATVSAANFLYSFLPALLGQVMFLLFAGLELSFQVLQPWAELAKHAGGARPEASILADYPACLPLQSTLHAALNQHWRIVTLSLVAVLAAFLPALAGGLFLASASLERNGLVRMVPNMALYSVVLTILILYFMCLVATLPCRNEFRLPHGVTSVAEILSFCANDDLAREPAFKEVHSREVLQFRLGVGRRPTARSRWIFATGTSGQGRRLGIYRVRRYTELTTRPSRRRPPRTLL